MKMKKASLRICIGLILLILVTLLFAFLLSRQSDTQLPRPSSESVQQSIQVSQDGDNLPELTSSSNGGMISQKELYQGLVEPVLFYYPGTAGSSLKLAAVSKQVLSFADQHGFIEVEAVPKLIPSEDTTRFINNLVSIQELLLKTREDYSSVEGLYADAGVSEEMTVLMEQTNAWDDCFKLISALLNCLESQQSS